MAAAKRPKASCCINRFWKWAIRSAKSPSLIMGSPPPPLVKMYLLGEIGSFRGRSMPMRGLQFLRSGPVCQATKPSGKTITWEGS